MEPIRSSGAIFDGIDLYVICNKDGRLPVLPSFFVEWLLSFQISTVHTSFSHLQDDNRLNPGVLSRVIPPLGPLPPGERASPCSAR